MREVKFRGKRIDNGEWVHGFIHVIDTLGNGYTGKAIQKQNGNSKPFSIQVDESTVGEYTGLKGKNGKEIFESDIVRFTDFDTSGGNREDREHIGIVKYQSGIYEIWKSNDSEYYGSDGAFILNHVWLQDDEFEIIGNIYDHPHLLEESL